MSKTERHNLPWVVNPIFQNQCNVIDSNSEDVCDFWIHQKDSEQSKKIEEILLYVNNYDNVLNALKIAHGHCDDELKTLIDKLLSVNN